MNRRVRDSLVGLLLLFGAALAVWAYLWFSGRIERGHKRAVTVHFGDVSGLRVGDPVQVRGLERGQVAAVALDSNGVRVIVALDRDVRLTDSARFAIRSISYLGGDRYMMVAPGTGPATARTVFEGRNEALDLEETFLKLDRLLAGADMNKLTDELARARDELMSMLHVSIGGVTNDFARLTSDISRIADHVDTLSARLNNESTVSKLASSTELYEELRTTNARLQELVTDIQAHPERYVKVRFSIFR